MALCEEIKENKEIKIETPFIIFGRNYTGQFISRIYVSKNISKLKLADENGLFELKQDETGAWYNLFLNRCALINVQACTCPVVNDLELHVNDSDEICTYPIYTVIPGHVENAATEANTFGKQLVLDFNIVRGWV